MKAVQGLQFCSFEGCSPQEQEYLHGVLHQDCEAVELYWNRRPARAQAINGYVPANRDYPAAPQGTAPLPPTCVGPSPSHREVGAGGGRGTGSVAAASVAKASTWPASAAEAPEFVPQMYRRPVEDCAAYMPPPPPGGMQPEAAPAPHLSRDTVALYMPPTPPGIRTSLPTPPGLHPSPAAPPGIRTSPSRVVVSAKGYFNDNTDSNAEERPDGASGAPSGAETSHQAPVGAQTPTEGFHEWTTSAVPIDSQAQPVASDHHVKKYERRNKKRRIPKAAVDSAAAGPPSSDIVASEAPARPADGSQQSGCDERTNSYPQPAAPRPPVILDGPGGAPPGGPVTSPPPGCPAASQPAVQSPPRPASPQKPELVASLPTADLDSTWKDNQNFPALERTSRGGVATNPLYPHQPEPRALDAAAPTSGAAPPPGNNKSVWGSKQGWAALFKDDSSSATTTGHRATPQREAPPPEKAGPPTQQPVTAAQDGSAKHLGGLLEKYVLCHRPVSLMPRGLVNRGNWCYINGTLQALLACPPFYHLLKSLPAFPTLERGPTSTPLMDSLIEFTNEFSPYVEPTKPAEKLPVRPEPGNKKKGGHDLYSGIPFEPKNVYKMLQVIKSEAEFKHGRQEDAEEFLSCVLNGLHDEMVAAINQYKNPEGAENPAAINGEVKPAPPATVEEGDEDQWEQVGPKNKSVVTRAAKCVDSPISGIFRGQIRSILHQPGLKESATLQPFFTLQLDIHHEGVWSVKDALEQLVSKESLQGFTCPRTKQEVEASRRITLETLPPVLVLHLKWFVYDKSGGSQKQLKKVEFSETLDISKDILSPNVKNKLHPNQRSYKLFAVLNHHGPRAVGGHYTTDIYHPGVHSWLHCDDSSIIPVSLTQVLKYSQPKVPYLIYYHRADLV